MSQLPFALDARSLTNIQTVLSFVTAAFTAPPYNFALHLFGVYAIEQTPSNEPLRLFAALLTGSMIWDLVWMLRHEQAGLVRALSIFILVLKVPQLSTVIASLQQRGDYFASRLGASDIGGSTVWSMPGGFTRQSGYDSLDGVEGGYNDAPAAPVQGVGPADGASRIPAVVAAPRAGPPQAGIQPPGGYNAV